MFSDVKYDGEVTSFGDLDLGSEGFFLPFVVWAVGHVVDADFAHDDDAFVSGHLVEGCDVVWCDGCSEVGRVDADAGVDVGVLLGERDGAGGIVDRGSGDDDGGYADLGGALKHAVDFGRVVLLDVGVDVDQHHGFPVSSAVSDSSTRF